MNSRVMLLLAVVLLLAAGIAGYLGYKATSDAKEEVRQAQQVARQAQVAATAATANKIPVVVAQRPIPAFQKITAEDISLDYVRVEPPQTFRRLEDLLGQVLQVNVAPGQLIDRQHLQPGGEIARLLRPGERAVAIAIDEVIGGGGFVQPGDSVDVLMYVPGDNRPSSSAQVVMRALRVVGMGTQVVGPQPPQGQGEQVVQDQTAARDARRQARTAVLAVNEPDVTRLMLASSVGILRLAIRPAGEQLADSGAAAPGRTGPGSNSLVRVGALVTGIAPAPVQAAPTYVRAAAPAAAVRPAKPSIVIFRGLNNNNP